MEYEEEKLTEGLVLARTRAVDLDGVKKLNFWGSEISDISVVRSMPNLEVCSVSVNSITTLADFARCKQLTELYIRKNKIENLAEIYYLKNLPRLRNLWLADNPCADRKNYRQTVLRTLPSLQKLDNVVVTEEERKEAEENGEILTPPEDYEEELNEDDQNLPENGEQETVKSEKNDESPKEENSPQTDKQTETNSEIKTPEHKPKMPPVKPKQSLLDPVTLTWEETNKIREELGLKPLPFEKITTPKPVQKSNEKSRNAHVLQAVLILIRELDRESLEIVNSATQKMLHSDI
ncbi:cilia- and flagella-associated protein 410-like [Saccostrea cucullata]|uniref:cilia- and flagella-associated protein 410-like n=1 Tax=Saccostrea cuccullata TaxID=36930 RepID=UPI002ED4FD39